MGSLSGNRSSSQSSTSVWDQMAPFLTDLYSQGQGLVNQFEPNQGITDQAQQAWGQQLNPQGNPHLDQMAGQFQDQLGIMNQQSGGQAGLTGGYGGGRQGIAQAQNTQNMGQQMGNFYGQQYQQDQNRAMGALQMAPGMMGMDPSQQRMNYLGQYANLLGRPVSESQSSSKGGGGGLSVN